MLNALRKKKTMKRIFWILAILVIPAFILWGAGSVSKKNLPYKYVGSIEGRKIPVEDFIKSLREARVRLFLNYFNQPALLRKLRNNKAFLNRLAWESLILDEKVKKEKIGVSDEAVVHFITNHPLFVRGGRFDEKSYKFIIRNSLGMLPRTFEESVRRVLAIQEYKERIVKDVNISDEELRRSYKEDFEKARFYYVTIDKDLYLNSVEPSSDEIRRYYEKNKAKFKEAEKVILQYVAFPHTKAGTKEKAIQNLNEALEKFRENPLQLAATAKTLGLTVKETIPFSRNEIIPELGGIKGLSSTPFELKPLTDITPVLDENETGTSYIIRVKEKIPSRIKKQDEVADIIIDKLKNKKALELAKKRAERIYEIGADKKLSLKRRLRKDALREKRKRKRRFRKKRNIAKKKLAGLKLKETELVSRSDYIEGVGEARKLVDEAFNLKVGEVSKPIEIPRGFALIEPIEFESMDEIKFEQEKQAYKERALAAKKAKRFREWLNNAKAQTTLYLDLDKI